MLLEKIESLKNIFKSEDKDSYDEILGWERNIQKYKRMEQLEKSDGVGEVIEDFTKVVAGCNRKLLNDRDLSHEQRLVVFERRENFKYFINLFKSAGKNLKEVEKQVDENLV